MPRSRIARRFSVLFLASLLVAPGAGGVRNARAQEPPPEKPLNGSVLLRLGIETAVVGFASFGLHPRTQDVPPSGLNSADIKLTWDRNAVQVPNVSAYNASDAFAWGSMLYSVGVSMIAPRGEAAGDARVRGLVMEAEAILLAMGTTTLLKVAFSRPRPYTYLPENERPPDNVKYDVTQDRAFLSFPSGHTSSTFAAATSGVAFLALERPDLPWGTQMANGAVAGGLAMATGLLRVEAVQHFPTDVLVGSLIGVGAGTAAAFLNGNAVGDAEDTRNAILAGAIGVGVGIGLALLFTPPSSPWVN